MRIIKTTILGKIFHRVLLVIILKMNLFIYIFVVIIAAVSAHHSSLMLEDWSYRDGDRFFYFPGDDGKIYLVDSQEPFDRAACSNCNGSREARYWLYTRYNPIQKQVLTMGDQRSVIQSSFNPNKITVFLSHGWKSEGNSEINLLLKKVFLNDADVNVIVLDWGQVANQNYATAKHAVVELGTNLGLFIDWLRHEFQLSLERVHMVGHSLGAHLVGNAGKTLYGEVKRITALDPAGPLWYRDDRHRVASTDARYVEIIHTNAFKFGYPLPSGHSDHYPNGGKSMPGCGKSDVVCHHSRSWRYLAASIERNRFLAHRCNNMAEAFDGVCVGVLALMGNSDINKIQYGLFKGNTTAVYPFI